jgi:murein DD-endopeptidase / murein LD-carboxypeptidase
VRTAGEIVAAARGCIGARFRPHGRDPAFGLDCVGVAGIAFDRRVPGDYALRGGATEAIGRSMEATGLVAIAVTEARAGDLVLMDGGPGQLHIGIMTDRGFVHADARLRRVIETPGRPARMIGVWREVG